METDPILARAKEWSPQEGYGRIRDGPGSAGTFGGVRLADGAGVNSTEFHTDTAGVRLVGLGV